VVVEVVVGKAGFMVVLVVVVLLALLSSPI